MGGSASEQRPSRTIERVCGIADHAVRLHRLAHQLWRSGRPNLATVVATINRLITGVEIEPGARIGPRFVIMHGCGIVIGHGATIGADVVVFQNVTIGKRRTADAEERSVFPRIDDGVTVYAGAVIVGPIRVGHGATVGANAVVISDVPPDAVAAGVPARAVLREPGPEQR